jgi:cytochrome b561
VAATAQRYTAVAIVLHWAIAVAILVMLPLGFWMHESLEEGNVSDGVYGAFQLHKSIGLTVLALSLVRLGWRLANPPPPLPEHMPAWERIAARATHWAFYGLMIGLPLTGWLYVSTGWSIHDDASLPVATRWFGLFQVPALFGLNQASEEMRSATATAAFTAHWLLAYAAIGLAALHVLAALKHHVFDKDAVLAHMAPGLRAPFEAEPPPKNPIRLAVLGGGLGVTTIALAAALFAISGYVANSSAPTQAPSTFEVVEPAPTPAPTTTTQTPAVESTTAAPAPGAAAAPTWRVNPAASSIRFAFTVDDGAGESRFEGRFTRWRADIRFDPNNLDASEVTVTIDTASADDGVATHNSYLPQEPWFNAAQYPSAAFTASNFRRTDSGYEARGRLTIKDRGRDVALPFTLTINGDRAVMNGQLAIDRRAYDIGVRTEADEMVSREVQVNVRVEAVRAP